MAEYEVPWHHPELREITKLRFLDAGDELWEVKECTGVMRNGDIVTVRLPHEFIPKGRQTDESLRSPQIHTTESALPALITLARSDKVFLNGLGVFEPGVVTYG